MPSEGPGERNLEGSRGWQGSTALLLAGSEHQLMVTGAAQELTSTYLTGRKASSVEVLPDPQDMEQLRLAWDDFWVLIRTDSPPPMTWIRYGDPVRILEWQSAAENYVAHKQAAEDATKAVEQATGQAG